MYFCKREQKHSQLQWTLQSQVHWVGDDWCWGDTQPLLPQLRQLPVSSPPSIFSVQGNQMTSLSAPEAPTTLLSKIAHLTSVVQSDSEIVPSLSLACWYFCCRPEGTLFVPKPTLDFLAWPGSRYFSSKPFLSPTGLCTLLSLQKPYPEEGCFQGNWGIMKDHCV